MKRSKSQGPQKLLILSQVIFDILQKKQVIDGHSLTEELQQHTCPPQQEFKNIQRRMYDALNVFSALNLISKNKNEIRYLGVPEECLNLKQLFNRIEEKRRRAEELVYKYLGIRELSRRAREDRGKRLSLPFVLIKGNNVKAVVYPQSCFVCSKDPLQFSNADQVFVEIGKLCKELIPDELQSLILYQ